MGFFHQYKIIGSEIWGNLESSFFFRKSQSLIRGLLSTCVNPLMVEAFILHILGHGFDYSFILAYIILYEATLLKTQDQAIIIYL